MSQEEQGKVKRSYWEVFLDDIFLLFFLSAAVMFIFYTTWGLIELGSVDVSPLVKS